MKSGALPQAFTVSFNFSEQRPVFIFPLTLFVSVTPSPYTNPCQDAAPTCDANCNGNYVTGSSGCHYCICSTGYYIHSILDLFWSIKNSGDILDKIKARDFNATSVSTYDFSTLYTTLPHNLIKDKLIDLIERTFQREGSPYLACHDRNAFFTSENPPKYHAWSCQNVCDALTFLLDNIFIRFGTKLYRQVVGIPMGTNCAPLIADLFLFCYERDFMMSLSDDKQADVIDAFNTTSRYLDDILNINNVYFDNMVSHIYPSELQLNKANTSDTEAAFLDLHLSISNDIVSTKIYDKRDDFDFEIVNFPFLDGDVPRSTSYGVYISQLIRFARASCIAADFNTCNKLLTQTTLTRLSVS